MPALAACIPTRRPAPAARIRARRIYICAGRIDIRARAIYIGEMAADGREMRIDIREIGIDRREIPARSLAKPSDIAARHLYREEIPTHTPANPPRIAAKPGNRAELSPRSPANSACIPAQPGDGAEIATCALSKTAHGGKPPRNRVSGPIPGEASGRSGAAWRPRAPVSGRIPKSAARATPPRAACGSRPGRALHFPPAWPPAILEARRAAPKLAGGVSHRNTSPKSETAPAGAAETALTTNTVRHIPRRCVSGVPRIPPETSAFGDAPPAPRCMRTRARTAMRSR